MTADGARALVVLPFIEIARRTVGPSRLLPFLRAVGRCSRERVADRRADLRDAIAGFDRFFPGGPNCYRRALAEIALDAHAAREPLTLGLASRGGRGTGHAWLGSGRGRAAPYDAEFLI